jgi:hypothetical protein
LLSGELMVVSEGNVTVGAAPCWGRGSRRSWPVQTLCFVNTSDTTYDRSAVEGSLRAAIEAANAAPKARCGNRLRYSRIRLRIHRHRCLPPRRRSSIPTSFVIGLSTPLPALTRSNILINGQSQQILTGATNPFGPEITLFGPSEGGNTLQIPAQNHVHGFSDRFRRSERHPDRGQPQRRHR